MQHINIWIKNNRLESNEDDSIDVNNQHQRIRYICRIKGIYISISYDFTLYIKQKLIQDFNGNISILR